MMTFLYYKNGDPRNYPQGLKASDLSNPAFLNNFFNKKILRELNERLLDSGLTTTDTLLNVEGEDYIVRPNQEIVYTRKGALKRHVVKELKKDFSLQYVKVNCPTGVQLRMPDLDLAYPYIYEINDLGYVEFNEPLFSNFYFQGGTLDKFQFFNNEPFCSIIILYNELDIVD